MMLRKLCEEISCNNTNIVEEGSPIGSRIVCPEYSLQVEERKTYPLPQSDPIFALTWCIKPNHILFGSLVPSPVSFSYRYKFIPGCRTQLHTHEYLELAYIVSGQFHQRILGKDITFQQGELCLIDKNCFHQDFLDIDEACVLFIGIANDMFHSIIANQVGDERIISFLKSAAFDHKNLWQYLHFKPFTQSSNHMEQYLLSLLRELDLHDKASDYICHGLLIRIFQLLSTEYQFFLSSEMQKKFNWLLFEEVTNYIKTHYKDISMKQLSEHFHFQEDYFNRLLKSKIGITYTEYVQNLRISEAERLLIHSNLTIEQIAATVGYQNKGYFYKLFTKKNNQTPAKYRKNNKEMVTLTSSHKTKK